MSVVFYLLILLAEVLGTLSGFGSSVFVVPVANFYFDFHDVLGLVALFHLLSNLAKISLFKDGIDKQLFLSVGVPSILFVLVGSILSKYFNPEILKGLLGVLLVTIGMALMLLNNVSFDKRNKKAAFIGGGISGLSAGLLGTGGAIRGLTLNAFNIEKNVFVATSALIDLGVDFSRTLVYAYNGFIQKELLYYVPVFLVISYVGTYVGKIILRRISQKEFKFFSILMIIGIGVLILIRLILKMTDSFNLLHHYF